MTPRPDITQPENMREVQGDRVLVFKQAEGGEPVHAYTLTLVRLMGGGRQEMRLVNRESRTHEPDWAFTQKWYDRLKPARENKVRAKWEVTVK